MDVRYLNRLAVLAEKSVQHIEAFSGNILLSSGQKCERSAKAKPLQLFDGYCLLRLLRLL